MKASSAGLRKKNLPVGSPMVNKRGVDWLGRRNIPAEFILGGQAATGGTNSTSIHCFEGRRVGL